MNQSRKPEHQLQENLIHENIQMYGIQCKYLFSERINEDKLVFRDFSHFKVGKDYVDIVLMPEDPRNWAEDNFFNSFGYYNNQTQHVFISRKTILEIYPDFEENGYSDLINSLILFPSGTLVEITDVEQYTEGVNNLFAYADKISSYKLTIKVYNVNLSDEGMSEIDTTISLDEGDKGSRNEGKIFEKEEEINTQEIDDFFNTLEITKTEQDIEGDKISDTGGVFGNLS